MVSVDRVGKLPVAIETVINPYYLPKKITGLRVRRLQNVKPVTLVTADRGEWIWSVIMKVLMLDIDGVLTTVSTKWKTFHPDCVKALKRVIETTGAKIVLSSSWRHGFIDWRTEEHRLVNPNEAIPVMKELFADCGLPAEALIDKTPFCKSEHRGDEISKWLEIHSKELGVEQYVVLDDDPAVDPHHAHFVQTSWGDGMNEKDADKAILILTSTTQ